jgi:CSLREA domain-containing protein
VFELGQGSGGRTGVVAATLIALALVLALPAGASAAPYHVNSTGDQVDEEVGDGVCKTEKKTCTLRAAIEELNESFEPGVINFDSSVFNGKPSGTITLGSSLPAISETVRINGDGASQCTTEAAAAKGPCVGISGPVSGTALIVEAPEVEIEGLAVTGAKVGVYVNGAEKFRAGDSWFGVKLDGKEGGNTTGLFIDTESYEVKIGGTTPALRNVFAHNSVDGLDILGASEVLIEGNYFGVKPDGKTKASNLKDIEVTDSAGIEASGVEIGAKIPAKELATQECDGACNVISGATTSGVDLQGDGAGKNEAPATGPTIINGNYIGLNAAGTGVIENKAAGILAGASGEVTVGGMEAGYANRFGGGEYGIYSEEGEGFQAGSNAIGVSAAGGNVAPPFKAGIFVSSPGVGEPAVIYTNTIRMEGGIGIDQQSGGATIEKNVVKGALNGILASKEASGLETFIEGNRIEGASANGILIESDLNQVLGNEVFGSGKAGIGVKQAGTLPTVSPTTENLVGGNTPVTENVISNSGGAAVEILNLEGTENGVGRNRGSGNDGPFIDLVATEPGAEPSGPNSGIKPPVISAGKLSEATGSAQAGATIRVFRKATASPGEIASFLGEAVANGSGNWTVVYPAIPSETQIAASQTGVNGGTSELSFAKAEPTTGSGGDGSGGGGSGGGGGSSDTKSPNTKILKAPPARTKATAATLKFSSDEPGSTFQCKLDGKPFKACRSPKKYKGLKPGKHVFQVRAVDAAENVDLSPAKKKFEVRR